MDLIYFDNAATTPIYPEVIEAMHATMQEDFGNPSSVHAAGRIRLVGRQQAVDPLRICGQSRLQLSVQLEMGAGNLRVIRLHLIGVWVVRERFLHHRHKP